MSANTTIEWATKSWNPIRGCSRVSEGCQNCYAEKQARRFAGPGGAYEGLLHPSGAWNGRIKYVPKLLDDPLKWRGERIFVNSMSDLFHEKVSDEFIDEVFQVMGASDDQERGNVFMILTKRADRMLKYMASGRAHEAWNQRRMAQEAFPPRNVWLGVSVENQATADERIPSLLQTPAAVRFLSCEPLLAPIDLQATCWNHVDEATAMRFARDVDGKTAALPSVFGIDWTIVGGESGNGARPFDIAWARAIVEQCRGARVPVFVKQLGANVEWDGIERPGAHWPRTTGSFETRSGTFRKHLVDRKGGDMDEWPEDMRVREFPQRERE